ncbi:MAG TPA: hypothetical protein VHO06_21525 [Polyangia bacterium]|nr:hypothetical protein [Polyangia bacterium]
MTQLLKWTLAATLLLGATALSCSNAGDDGVANDLEGRQCSWPSSLNDADGRTACQPARAFVSCTDSTGAGCECLSDQVSCACQAAGVTCQDKCAANQYAVACGGVGPGAVPSPPDGCTFAGANPGGVAYYCCPCG